MAITKIATQTLASTVSSITFSSIPGTFTDLWLTASARGNNAGVNDDLIVSFNGSGSNHSWRILYGTGSSAGSTSGSSNGRYMTTTGATATSNTFGSSEIYIPNYAGSTNKSVSGNSVSENNATGVFMEINAGLWANTAAITSLTVAISPGTLLQIGSTFTLYGVTKGSLAGVTVS